MRIGLFDGDVAGPRTLEALLDRAETAEALGLDSFWIANFSGHDAVSVAMLAATLTSRIEVGTNVTPAHPRHPLALAQQARTAARAANGRFTLGIGASHRILVEDSWGISYDKPRSYMADYLTALVPAVAGEKVNVITDRVTARGQLNNHDHQPVGVVMAALGPKMVDLAARSTDGITTWLVGPKTIRTMIAPTVAVGAAAAKRPPPRVVAGIPVCVTDQPDTARTRAGELFGYYDQLPAYRAALDRDQQAGAAGAAVIGSATQVADLVAAYATAGATEIAVFPFGTPQEQHDTLALLGDLVTNKEI